MGAVTVELAIFLLVGVSTCIEGGSKCCCINYYFFPNGAYTVHPSITYSYTYKALVFVKFVLQSIDTWYLKHGKLQFMFTMHSKTMNIINFKQ